MQIVRKLALACAFSLLAWNSAMSQDAAGTTTYKPHSGQPGKDVVWVPTAQALVDRMLDMAAVTKEDYVIDLGSGDGRTVITAAKRGVRAHGIEYNPDMVALSRRNAEEAGVSRLATFERADIFETDFSKATVVTLFLLPSLNVRLRPTLLKMKPGTRVVSNSFDMGNWEPDDRAEVSGECSTHCRAMKWVVPANVAGSWRLGHGELRLVQTYQMLSGTLTQDGPAMPVSDARMDGERIQFTASGKRYTGRIDGGAMVGTTQGGGEWRATRVAN